MSVGLAVSTHVLPVVQNSLLPRETHRYDPILDPRSNEGDLRL